MKSKFIVGLAIASIAAVSVAQAPQTMPETNKSTEQIMVVLDASGSMWGRVDGRTKISVVRDAYADLMKTWDEADVESGLILYGHRRKGDCSDIELISRPGQTDSHSLGRTVAKLNPKGKTPIGASVRQAAEELKYTEQKATVILLSDGIETCGVDPCQLGRDLEALGVDFTTHVIGFDLGGEATEQLQCLARNTGGRFLQARNTSDLKEAFEQVADISRPLSLQGLVAETGEAAPGMMWTITRKDGVIVVEQRTETSTLSMAELADGQLPDGDYTVTGRAKNYSGSTNFTLPTEKPVIYVRLFPDVPYTRLRVEGDILSGDEFTVAWEGIGGPEDAISIVPRGADWGQAISTVHVRTGNPVSLKAPPNAGDYDLLYLNSDVELNRIDERMPVTVLESLYALNAAGAIRAGQSFTINWRGPALEGDMIAIGPRTSGRDDYSSMTWIESEGPVSLTAPDMPGDYELRYYGDGYVVQFVQPVRVQ